MHFTLYVVEQLHKREEYVAMSAVTTHNIPYIYNNLFNVNTKHKVFPKPHLTEKSNLCHVSNVLHKPHLAFPKQLQKSRKHVIICCWLKWLQIWMPLNCNKLNHSQFKLIKILPNSPSPFIIFSSLPLMQIANIIIFSSFEVYGCFPCHSFKFLSFLLYLSTSLLCLRFSPILTELLPHCINAVCIHMAFHEWVVYV